MTANPADDYGRCELGHQLKGVQVGWPYHREMHAIQRGDLAGTEALGRGDDRGVGAPQRQVAVGSDQGRDPHPVTRLDGLWHQLAGGEIPKKANLALYAEPSPEKVNNLGNHQDRDQNQPWITFEQAPASDMLGVVSVVGRVERTRIDDQRVASSDLRISSMR